MSERKTTMNSNEIKERETQEENVSMAPYVNEKVKYVIVAVVIILCIITALCVVFGSKTEKKQENKESEPTQTAILLQEGINT